MRYRANKKVSRQCRRQQDPHQKVYVSLPFGGGHIKQCLLDIDTPCTVMVKDENYYQEYKGHTNWLSLISSHFAKNIFLA